MRYDSEHKGRTRDRVLKEAAAALRTDGPDRVGVAAVMNRAGLTHGGFYAHFRSRDELLTEAVDHMFKDRYDAFFADLDTVDPHLALRRLVDYYLSTRHRDARDQGCPVPILSGELHRLPGAAQERFVRAVDRLTDGIATLLARASIKAPRSRAVSAVAEMVGAIAISRTLGTTAAEELLAHAKASVEQKFGLVPPVRSSVGPPGACITPLSDTKAAPVSLRIDHSPEASSTVTLHRNTSSGKQSEHSSAGPEQEADFG